MEAFYFCKKTGSSLWTPKTISDFENDKILDLLRSSNPNLRDGRLFWTGMERFNDTHFIYGESKHFLPSEYFNWATISFMPTVITHVPLLNIHICPELLEMYVKKQRLKNAEPKVSIYMYFSLNEIKQRFFQLKAFCICCSNRPFWSEINAVCQGLLPITIPIFILILLWLIFQVVHTLWKIKLTTENLQQPTGSPEIHSDCTSLHSSIPDSIPSIDPFDSDEN